jgi:methylated-DNA-[protein]-cysteine S-methyltransferase
MKKREPSEFEQRVYDATRRIPKGKVTTYKLLAAEIECGSNQAVGQALKRNPFAPEVPCHRVVRTDLSIGGFYGQTEGREIVRKNKMLQQEGVDLDGRGRVPADLVFVY